MIDIPYNFTDLELVARVLLSVGLGAIVGFEREITRKPAGLRTHMFVCMGACLFTISSFYMLPENLAGDFDATRIAAGIVAGISFIGAGSIIASGGDVRGLTTAASLWVVSAIGLMIGLGNYLLAVIASILSFFILRLGKVQKEKLDKHFE
ncbi:MAG: MgtC/SapB family protein [Candidatus Thermoplasmatota archaeon]